MTGQEIFLDQLTTLQILQFKDINSRQNVKRALESHEKKFEQSMQTLSNVLDIYKVSRQIFLDMFVNRHVNRAETCKFSGMTIQQVKT